MKIDNTQFVMYMKCPMMWYERYEAKYDPSVLTVPTTKLLPANNGDESLYIIGSDRTGAGGIQPVQGIEPDEPAEGRDFGTRFHQLVHERRCRGLSVHFLPTSDWPDESIEAECQSALAGYEAHYIRDYEYLESERTSVVPLPARCPTCWEPGLRGSKLGENERYCERCEEIFEVHELVVKIDAVVRYGDGTIGPMDTKTESKPGYNTREDWAGRTQAKIYLYALGKLYPDEKVSRLTVDVVTRGSPKARRGPLFSRLDDIACAPAAIEEAIRNVAWVAEDIQKSRRTGFWRSNMNVCKRGWEKCDFFNLHVLGKTAENLKKFRPAEKYLDL